MGCIFFIVVFVLWNWVGRFGMFIIWFFIDNCLIKVVYMVIFYGYCFRYLIFVFIYNFRLLVYVLF